MLTMPSFVVLIALTAVPLIFSLGISLFEYNITKPQSAGFAGIGNFVRAFKDEYFRSAIKVTVIQVVSTVTGQMVLGMLIALLLSREFKGVKLLRSLYIIPMMITPVVSGIMWRMMFNADLGIVNYLLGKLNVPAVNWLGSPKTALVTIIATDIWLSTPFVTMILLADTGDQPGLLRRGGDGRGEYFAEILLCDTSAGKADGSSGAVVQDHGRYPQI